MIEYWDIYDANRNKTGRLHQRGIPLSASEYHLVVDIWTVNYNGQILLTLRHPQKSWGNLWECTCGSIIAGEDSITGAKRELLEETGIVVSNDLLIALGNIKYQDKFVDTYLVKDDTDITDLKLLADEVIDAKWVDIQTFTEMCVKKLVVPSVVKRFNLYRNNIIDIILGK